MMHSKKWLESVLRANQKRRGTKNAFSVSRSKKMKAMWLNPAYRQKMMVIRKEQATHPERAIRFSRSMRKYWASLSPEQRKERTKNFVEGGYRAACAPESRKLASARTSEQNKRQWANPDFRKKMSISRKRVALEHRAELSAAAKKLWSGKSGQKMRTERAARWKNPAFKKKMLRLFRLHQKPVWNKGKTKETDHRLAATSTRLRGCIPDYKKYGCYYQRGDKKIWMRSGWEVAYARWLDSQKIKWRYELVAFHVGPGDWRGTTYTPDFFLEKSRVYVEIKGYLSDDNIKKMDAFHRIHPEIKVEMLRKSDLIKMGVITPRGLPRIK